jgi:hypothetical protein
MHSAPVNGSECLMTRAKFSYLQAWIADIQRREEEMCMGEERKGAPSQIIKAVWKGKEPLFFSNKQKIY